MVVKTVQLSNAFQLVELLSPDISVPGRILTKREQSGLSETYEIYQEFCTPHSCQRSSFKKYKSHSRIAQKQ